jgi:serine/threonine-protein kinase
VASPRWRAVTRRLLPYLVAAAGGFLSAYLVIFFFVFPSSLVPNDQRVPDVLGLLYDDAARRLTTAGFEAARGEEVQHAAAPKSTVLRQDPVAGELQPKGMRVILDVSAGQRRAIVPDVNGMTRQEAEAALEKAGLDAGEALERAGNGPRGQVLGSTPAAGAEVVLPAAVTLFVSTGPAGIQVPDLVGQTLTDARAMLEQVGLSAGAVRLDSTALQPANTVLAQSPAAGSAVRAGTGVSLTVSAGVP